MLESIILGAVQGISEWLPVSSEGVIVLIQMNFLDDITLEQAIRMALFLHLGTFFAALLYFRKDIKKLLKALFNFKNSTEDTKKVFWFLIIATLISGLMGIVFLQIVIEYEDKFSAAKFINLFIAAFLLITGYLQLRSQKDGLRKERDIKKIDGVILGLVQGLSPIPGLSRSGLTVSALLLRKFNDIDALRLSFLLSLPIVLGGNIFLNLNKATLTLENIVGVLSAFIFGYLTIHLFLKTARKLNFGYFVLGFAFLVIISVFI